MNGIIVELSKRPYIRVWRNETGAYPSYRKDADGDLFLDTRGRPVIERYTHYGLPGSPDIIGIGTTSSGVGVFIGIECKTGHGRLSERQNNFRAMVEQLRGIYIEARSVDATVALVEEILCQR